MSTSDFSLAGLRALVTGGGSGIGREIANKMTEAGAKVLVCDSNANTKPDLICDASDSEQVAKMFDEVKARIGKLDVLVNNVGVPGPTATVEQMDPHDFDDAVRICLGSAFRCTRLAVPMLRETRGSIINISSTAGIFGYPLRSPYVAAKWGVIGLTHTWAMELGPQGIRVNAICPGSVSGSRMDGVIEREAKQTGIDKTVIRQGYENQVSMQSFIEASDVAATAVYLSSPAARFVSGQVLAVDGHTETLRSV